MLIIKNDYNYHCFDNSLHKYSSNKLSINNNNTSINSSF